MGNTKDTGFLRNLISYDASGNIVLPANLTVTGSLLTNGGGSYATQSYVTTQISNLVNAAPGALDTLNELATALGNDANFSTTVTNSIATKLALSGGTLTGALNGTSATFSSSISATSLSIGSTANSTSPASGSIVSAGGMGLGGDIYIHPFNANQSNYAYFKTSATTVNTLTLTIGTTYGFGTGADAISIYNGQTTFGDTSGYTLAQKGQFYSKGGGSMFTANLLSGGWGRHFTMQRNDSTKFHIGVDGSDNFAIMNSSDSYLMTVSSASEITSWNGEMYFKRSAYAHYGHIYMGSNNHFYIRNSGNYNMYLQTNGVNHITLQNDGTTSVSSLRTSTLHTEFTKNLSGAYSSGTYYKICDSSELTASGIYMIVAYVDTYAIGGGIYFCTFASVPFYWFAGSSNSSSVQTLPTMLGTGHHNLTPPTIRIRLDYGVNGAKQYLEFDPNANWSNVQGVGGATVTFYIKRIGS